MAPNAHAVVEAAAEVTGEKTDVVLGEVRVATALAFARSPHRHRG